ncbi:MAG: hypothetical protein AAGA99_03990 [Actinomycetota bacterium]
MAERPDDLDRLRTAARDGLYVAVGFGVLGYQRFRIAQRAVSERLGLGDEADPAPPGPAERARPWLDLRDED